MNTSLFKQMQQKQAINAYKNAKLNLTTKELIVKSLSKSIFYIDKGIEGLETKKYAAFAQNTNNAITLIQNLQFNLDLSEQSSYKTLAIELNDLYSSLIRTLSKGLINKNSEKFDECKKILGDLETTFKKIN